MWWSLQGDIELLRDFLYHIGSDGVDDIIQYGLDLWWAVDNDMGLAHCGLAHFDCGPIDGWDLLCLSYFWWALFLECQALWKRLGPNCFLVHRLVSSYYYLYFFMFSGLGPWLWLVKGNCLGQIVSFWNLNSEKFNT